MLGATPSTPEGVDAGRSAGPMPAARAAASIETTQPGSGSKDTSSGSAASTSPSATVAGTSSAGSEKVSLSAAADGSLAFNTTKLTAKAGTVSLVMSNPGSSGIGHGIAISGNGVNGSGQVVDPGATSTVTAKLKPGTYTFFCP